MYYKLYTGTPKQGTKATNLALWGNVQQSTGRMNVIIYSTGVCADKSREAHYPPNERLLPDLTTACACTTVEVSAYTHAVMELDEYPRTRLRGSVLACERQGRAGASWRGSIGLKDGG